MAGFDGSAGVLLGTVVTPEPGGTMAGFDPSTRSGPAGGMAGFGSSTWRAKRRYRATVSRSTPSSRAIRRWDQPPRLNVLIACCISILSWCIAAQDHETDPDCNDYLTSKWLGLIRPLLAGFDRPLTPSRSAGHRRHCSCSVPVDFKGTVQCDGYAAYDRLAARPNQVIKLAGRMCAAVRGAYQALPVSCYRFISVNIKDIEVSTPNKSVNKLRISWLFTFGSVPDGNSY